MDNKKWGKRFSTIFWWTLTILPLLISLIYFIGYHLTFNSGITEAQDLTNYHTSGYSGYFSCLADILIDGDFPFLDWQIPAINRMFYDLFDILEIDNCNYLGVLFGWMTSVQLYHLLYDVAVWLFRMFHSWLERWC